MSHLIPTSLTPEETAIITAPPYPQPVRHDEYGNAVPSVESIVKDVTSNKTGAVMGHFPPSGPVLLLSLKDMDGKHWNAAPADVMALQGWAGRAVVPEGAANALILT